VAFGGGALAGCPAPPVAFGGDEGLGTGIDGDGSGVEGLGTGIDGEGTGTPMGGGVPGDGTGALSGGGARTPG